VDSEVSLPEDSVAHLTAVLELHLTADLVPPTMEALVPHLTADLEPQLTKADSDLQAKVVVLEPLMNNVVENLDSEDREVGVAAEDEVAEDVILTEKVETTRPL
jgi:hypothetical protein